MPLIRETSLELDSFLDVAIKDEEEINPVVCASRVQSSNTIIHHQQHHHHHQQHYEIHHEHHQQQSTNNDGSESTKLWNHNRRRSSRGDGSIKTDDFETGSLVSMKSSKSKEMLTSGSLPPMSSGIVGNINDMNSLNESKHGGNKSCDYSIVSRQSYGGASRDDASSVMGGNNATSSVTAMRRTMVTSNKTAVEDPTDDLDLSLHPTKNNAPDVSQSNNDNSHILEQEMAKISFELAEARSQVDWYKLKYRHLHVEFSDLQAFCKQLQSENMELRFEKSRRENCSGPDVNPSTFIIPNDKSAWFKSDHLLKLNRPRKWADYESCNNIEKPQHQNRDDTSDCGEDWDNDTLTTQFCESSISKSSYITGSDNKPRNITVRSIHSDVSNNNPLGLEANGNNHNHNHMKQMSRRHTMQTSYNKEEKQRQQPSPDERIEVASLGASSFANKAKSSNASTFSFMNAFSQLSNKNESNNLPPIAPDTNMEKPPLPKKIEIKPPSQPQSVPKQDILLRNIMMDGKQTQLPWWTKVKIKKPFGQMQITAFKNISNPNLCDIDLSDDDNDDTKSFASSSEFYSPNNAYKGYNKNNCRTAKRRNSSASLPSEITSPVQMPIDLSTDCTVVSENSGGRYHRMSATQSVH